MIAIWKQRKKISLVLHSLIVIAGFVATAYWITGEGLFYSDSSPVLSPFTSFSLFLMSLCRLAERTLETWSKPMTLAILGIVACGNISSILMLTLVPQILLLALPQIPATSIMTSVGLVTFCFYEILVVLRKTPQNIFLLDDILIHLALFPGGLSLLGHILDVPSYIGIGSDPRAGIGKFEMVFMGTYAIVAVLSNPNLFLWKFLSKNSLNRFIFILLIANQYVAPAIVGFLVRPPNSTQPGLELFVMLAGVLATLLFLMINAHQSRTSMESQGL